MIVDDVLSGMTLEGWVMHVNTTEGPVKYGLFPTKQEAFNWSCNFKDEIIISPVYSPGYNRG